MSADHSGEKGLPVRCTCGAAEAGNRSHRRPCAILDTLFGKEPKDERVVPMSEPRSEIQPVPYGKGTSENGGCDECWKVPSRHCCLWNVPEEADPDD